MDISIDCGLYHFYGDSYLDCIWKEMEGMNYEEMFSFVNGIISDYEKIKTEVENDIRLLKEMRQKLEDEEDLKDEINRLQDPEYMARYAREKYLYSKKDEIIIKIED